jgi:hypothetical protein
LIRFRVKVSDRHHVAVRVYDTVKQLHAASREIHGTSHPRDCAVTIAPGDPQHGCIAYMLFCHKYAAPHIIAHECSHAAFACALILGPGVDCSDSSDERVAHFVEILFRAIFRRVHA